MGLTTKFITNQVYYQQSIHAAIAHDRANHSPPGVEVEYSQHSCATVTRGSYILSVIISGVSTAKGNACLLCSVGAERLSGVLSSVVRSVYSFLLHFHYIISHCFRCVYC